MFCLFGFFLPCQVKRIKETPGLGYACALLMSRGGQAWLKVVRDDDDVVFGHGERGGEGKGREGKGDGGFRSWD